MKGLFITFEGNEGSGKSTQIALLANRLKTEGYSVRTLREPGGTPIGEEIRHTLKHSEHNERMTPEAELLLLNASRAQLVREIIRPALQAGELVLCDRFYDSTTAYQAHGRGLDQHKVQAIVEFAVGDTRPDLTFLLLVSEELSQQRRRVRQTGQPSQRDRFEQADAAFFLRVTAGYEAIAQAEPHRVVQIDAASPPGRVESAIWDQVRKLLDKRLHSGR